MRKERNEMIMKKDTMNGSKKSSGKIILTAAVLFVALLFICAPAAGASSGDDQRVSELTLSLCKISVSTDSVIGNNYTIDGQQASSALVIKGGSAEIQVGSLPSGYTLEASVTIGADIVRQGLTVTVSNVLSENVTVTLKAVKPSPSPSPSGGGSIWVQLQDAPAVITTDVTRLYSGVPFFAATAGNLREIQSVYPVYADELAEKFAAAEAAGYKLVNSRGAPALAVLEHPDEKVIKETFCKVYEVTPVYAGAKIEKVEITVPMTDITASGLPYQDVNIYHGVDLPGVTGAGSGAVDLWIPLEILSISFDEKNYYFTAATDGASPFGVLLKKLDAPEVQPIPSQTGKTPVPFAGVLAGLGAAAAVLCLRRK
ncbi:MAG TPA: hypothetical protein O0X84_02085 [Methanocorpusculum sp.]|nr:hypothetical protein [Methanocorpusculum sp.]